MAPSVVSPVPGNRNSSWYTRMPGNSRQTSAAMSTHFETFGSENISVNGSSSRRESGLIRGKVHSKNAYINSAAQRYGNESFISPFTTNADRIGDWIALERMSSLPPEGSANDKVLSWAQLFVERLHEFDGAIKDDSTAVTSFAYSYVEHLLNLGKENEENARALMTSFGFFYSLSSRLVDLLDRTELFDVSSDIRYQLNSALIALVDLVHGVTRKFDEQIRGGSAAMTIELYETFHSPIVYFREKCDSIAETMWFHQIAREPSLSVSGLDIKNIRPWLSPEDRVLSRLAENTSHFAYEREEMTCRWIGPHLSDFLKSSKSVLSLSGKPGSGKTILASVIVDCVSDQANDYMTLFVPINARIPAETTSTAIAKTILHQLFEKRIGNVKLLSILDRAYKDSCAITDVNKYDDIMWNAVEAALNAALPKAKDLVVVVDGVDEASCSEKILFERLSNATIKASSSVRLITLGAEKQDESEKVMSFPISANRIFEDVSIVVRKIFTNPKGHWSKIFNNLDEIEQEIMIDQITESSQGSFLWAKLCTKLVCHEKTPDAMNNVLEVLVKEKPSVEDFVTRILSTPGVSDQAKYMLLWLATAERPLVPNELSVLASVQVDKQTITDPNIINLRTILSPVNSLIFFDNGLVYLRHGLIRTALLDIASKGKLLPVKDRHLDFVTRLLVYIKNTVTESHEPSLEPLPNYEAEKFTSKNSLLDFAVRYWPSHLRQTGVYTTGGDTLTTKEFTKLFPVNVTVLLLQAALWQSLSTPKRVAFQTTVTNMTRQIFTTKSPITLQSILNLALLYHNIGQGPEATTLVYELTDFPTELLDIKSLVTLRVATLFLELTSKPENVTSKMNLTVKLEYIYTLLISCYESHYGSTHELVIKTYRALVEHYRSTGQETKIKDIQIKIDKITGQYDQDGTHDELTVVVRPGAAQDVTDGSKWILEIEEDDLKTEVIEDVDFQALFEKAQHLYAQNHITEAEQIFVQIWQHSSTQYSEYWEQMKLQVTLAYAYLLKSQKRESECTSILSSIWEEYRNVNMFVSKSTASYFQQIATTMEAVGLSTAALNIFQQISQHYKSSGYSKSSISEIEQHIQRTHKSVLHQASSSSSSSITEDTLIETFYEYTHSGAEVDTSTFKVLFSKVDQYTSENRWKDSTRIIKKILRKLWPSLFLPSVNDVTLPKEYADRCVELAVLLGKCYHYRRRFPREEDIRLRVYRALRQAKPVPDSTRKDSTDALILFYEQTFQPDSAISIKEEKLSDYKGHYGPENPMVVQLLRELARDTQPRPAFVDYYVELLKITNKDPTQCHPNVIKELIIVVDELWRQCRYPDVRPWFDLLFTTFLVDPKRSPDLQNQTFVHDFFGRYTECMRKTHVDYETIVQITEQYQTKVKSIFTATASITIKASLTLAMVYQESKAKKNLALNLYKELSKIQSNEIDYDDINAAIHGIQEEEEAVALHSSASSEEVKKVMKKVTTHLRSFVEKHSWSSQESLTKLEEMISLHSQYKEEKTTLHEELHKSTFQILSTKMSSTQLVSAATTIASGFITTLQGSQAGSSLSSEIYRQILMKDTANSTQKLDLSQGRQSLIFLAQLEHSLHSRSGTIHEILASLTAEYLAFEEFRKLTSSKSATFVSVCQSASSLYTLLIKNKRVKAAERVKEDYISYFVATEGKRTHVTEAAQVRIFLSTLLEHFSKYQPGDHFLRSVGIASYFGVQGHLDRKEYDSAYNLAEGASRYISAGNEFRSQTIVKYTLSLGLLIYRYASAVEDIQAAQQKQLVRVSSSIIQSSIGVIRDLNLDISQVNLDDLNVLIRVLGEQKQYESLLWILSSLWESRKKQQVMWSAGITMQLARRYILARYLNGDGLKAARLAEDILYNCRRVNGPAHSSTLDMSVLLSQMYTGAAGKFLRSKGGEHMAKRLYKKVAGVHEHLLRIFLDPNLGDLDGVLDGSLEGSTYEFDFGDSTISDPYTEGEHIRKHLQYMKLAIQRLGDWPQEYSEYKDLDERVFAKFGHELEGFDHVDAWNLKSFGSGKASGDDDVVNVESTGPWELTL